MAVPFTVELSVPDSAEEAQGRAAQVLHDPARSIGLRLSKRSPGALRYSPRYQFPFVVMLYHVLNGEGMTVSFKPGSGGGTQVSISGKVAKGRHPLAADPELWTEALGGSPA